MSKDQSKLTTPRIPKGHMELLPPSQLVFNRMLDTIRAVYERYGFTPIETPALELYEILFAQGGGETDKQIFEAFNGKYSVETNAAGQQVYTFDGLGDRLALRFDLTVPLARYVAQHEPELLFPFRRYQIQPVWRAERNQKGRFRSFYQCDIDTIGSYSPQHDAEIPRVIYDVFTALDCGRFTIRINNRKILNGFFESVGLSERSVEVLRAVDKLDKIGRSGVTEQLVGLGIQASVAEQLLDFVQLSGSNDEIITQLHKLGASSPLFEAGVRELSQVYSLMVQGFDIPVGCIKIDLSIARGLDYYTGTVYETILNEHPEIGSVCSGGRYDDLAGHYTNSDLPGVGISIGLTRLFSQLQEADLITTKAATPAQALVLPMTDNSLDAAMAAANLLRAGGIPTQTYYEDAKPKKMLQYADRMGVPIVAMIRDEDVAGGTVTLKDLRKSADDDNQQTVAIGELVATVKELL